MNKPKTLRIVFMILCTCIAWVGIITTAKSFATLPRISQSPLRPAHESANAASDALVEKALNLRNLPPAPHYDATFDAPFKSAETAQKESVQRAFAGPRISRAKFVLKGILFRSAALAILADQTGATFILGVGDSLAGQKILSIKKTAVTLRDKAGSYTLEVKD